MGKISINTYELANMVCSISGIISELLAENEELHSRIVSLRACTGTKENPHNHNGEIAVCQSLIETNNNRINRLEELKTAIITTNESVANAERILLQMLLCAPMQDGSGFENLKGFEFGKGVLDNNDLGMTASLNMLRLLASNKNLSTEEAANISLLAAKAAGLRVTEGGSVCINSASDAEAYYEAYNNKPLLAATAAGVRFVNGTPQITNLEQAKAYSEYYTEFNKIRNQSKSNSDGKILNINIMPMGTNTSDWQFEKAYVDKFGYIGCPAVAFATCYRYVSGDNTFSALNLDWNGGLIWPEDKCETYLRTNQETVYEKVINSIDELEQPCVLKVINLPDKKDEISSTHWVSVIGYLPGTDKNNPKLEDFIVIDPGNSPDSSNGQSYNIKDRKLNVLTGGADYIIPKDGDASVVIIKK